VGISLKKLGGGYDVEVFDMCKISNRFLLKNESADVDWGGGSNAYPPESVFV